MYRHCDPIIGPHVHMGPIKMKIRRGDDNTDADYLKLSFLFFRGSLGKSVHSSDAPVEKGATADSV